MAAPTLVLVSATPNALKYLFTDDGTGGGATKTLAQLIADAKTALPPAASPIAAYLASLTDVSWPLSSQGAEISFYANLLGSAASGFGVAVAPQNTAPTVNSLLVMAKTGTALSAIIELRFHNTIAG